MPKKTTRAAKSTVATKKKTAAVKTSTAKVVKKIPVKKTSSRTKATVLRTAPKDVFMHLLMLVMLYIGVISLIALCFSYVDYSFPDPLNYYRTGVLDSIRFNSAMLVVSFPLLLVLAHFVQADFRKQPAKHDLRFYKWLTYLTLFISAITIVVDLIQLVNRFYSGELTTSFLLKVLSVLLIAGAVFGYYIWDVQSDSYKSKVPARVAWGSSVVVVVMLGLGFALAGSPSHQRDIRMDEERVDDLSFIQSQITYYWQQKDQLPSSLLEVEQALGNPIPNDPETNQYYTYNVLAPLSFELCAQFSLPSDSAEGESRAEFISPYALLSKLGTWQHSAGKVCFQRTIDPDLYKS